MTEARTARIYAGPCPTNPAEGDVWWSDGAVFRAVSDKDIRAAVDVLMTAFGCPVEKASMTLGSALAHLGFGLAGVGG